MVWLQSGITAPEGFRSALAAAGIRLVSDRCLMVERRAALAAAGNQPPPLPSHNSHL